MRVPTLYEIYAFTLLAASVFLLIRAMLLCRLLEAIFHAVAPLWRVPHRVAHKIQFRRLIRRHYLVGPWYISKVSACVLYLVLNGALLSVQVPGEGVRTTSALLTTVSDAAARAKYLALLNLTVIYLSPHHHGVADVFGLSLQLFRQVHRVMGLVSMCLLLFFVATTLANAPSAATATSDGQIGLMVRPPLFKTRFLGSLLLSRSLSAWLLSCSRRLLNRSRTSSFSQSMRCRQRCSPSFS